MHIESIVFTVRSSTVPCPGITGIGIIGTGMTGTTIHITTVGEDIIAHFTPTGTGIIHFITEPGGGHIIHIIMEDTDMEEASFIPTTHTFKEEKDFTQLLQMEEIAVFPQRI